MKFFKTLPVNTISQEAKMENFQTRYITLSNGFERKSPTFKVKVRSYLRSPEVKNGNHEENDISRHGDGHFSYLV